MTSSQDWRIYALYFIILLPLAFGGYTALKAPWTEDSMELFEDFRNPPGTNSDNGDAAGSGIAAINELQGFSEEFERQRGLERREEEQRHATAKARLELFLPHEERALKLIDEAEAEVERWKKEIVPLRTNDRGKHIAASDEAVVVFDATMRATRAPLEQPLALRKSLEALYAPIKRAISDDEFAHDVGADVSDHLADVTTAAQFVTESYRKDRLLIEGLITANPEPSDKTIEQRYSEVAAELAEAFSEQMAKRLAIVRAEEERKRLEQHEELLRAQQEAERARDKAAADIARKKVDDERQQMLDEANKQRKTELANSARVKQKLAPFTTPGWITPFNFGFGANPRLEDKRPVSYAALKTSGALEPSLKGLTWLVYIGCTSKDQDRPRWSYIQDGAFNPKSHTITPQQGSRYYVSEASMEEVREVQELLRDLGPVLVELGMLAP